MQRRAADVLKDTNEFQAVFRQLPERKLLISAREPDFEILDVTDSYAAMIEMSRDVMIGQPYFTVFPSSESNTKEQVGNLRNAFKAVIRTKEPQIQHIFRHDIVDPKDETQLLERYWRTTLYPILGSDGAVTHILQVSANATGEVLVSLELEEAQQHLSEALEAGKVGSWTWDIGTNVVIGNAGLAKIFAVDELQVRNGLNLDDFFQIIHKDDRDRVASSLQNAIDSNTLFDTEFRVVSGDATRWVIGRGKVLERHGVRRFSGVSVDVTERRDLQAQIELARQQDRLNRAEAKMLQERNDELEAISRTKDEFVALASHQLRTPATAVKQYVGMVLQGYAGDISDLQKEMLAKAFESNERQIAIVNQILNAARADTGKLNMVRSPTDIVALARGVTDELRQDVEKHGHTFATKLPRRSIGMNIDPIYVRMAIENLISNANKYTPEGGTIVVSLHQRADAVELTVQDTGVGIAADDMEKLFVKFERIDNPLSVQAGGSGIGLYLAAEIIRLHEGTIRVRSTPGQGTTFTIVIPQK